MFTDANFRCKQLEMITDANFLVHTAWNVHRCHFSGVYSLKCSQMPDFFSFKCIQPEIFTDSTDVLLINRHCLLYLKHYQNNRHEHHYMFSLNYKLQLLKMSSPMFFYHFISSLCFSFTHFLILQVIINTKVPRHCYRKKLNFIIGSTLTLF
jgi:hypothetical protein